MEGEKLLVSRSNIYEMQDVFSLENFEFGGSDLRRFFVYMYDFRCARLMFKVRLNLDFITS